MSEMILEVKMVMLTIVVMTLQGENSNKHSGPLQAASAISKIRHRLMGGGRGERGLLSGRSTL